MEDEQKRELTYGQKAVGLPFNPSGDERVNMVKAIFADLIDTVEQERTPNDSRFKNTIITSGVTMLVNAQMIVVKILTWKDEA